MSKSSLQCVLLAFPSVLASTGCDPGVAGGPAADASGGPLRVLATTGMIADVAARIAGPHARVEALMGPGVDPHLYKASEGDVRRLEAAVLVLYNGLNLEGKLGDILGKLARSKRVLALSDSVPRDRLRQPPEFAGHHDPHVWFDVALWKLTVGPIARALAALDPAHAADFERNAAELERDLADLDAWVERRVAEVPAGHRVLVTAHDAFGYFGRRYGIDVVALQGISTAAEAAIRDVERVVEVIVKRQVKAIFVESSVPRRTIESVVRACAARGHAVTIGGELFSDALGAAGTREGTYRGMVEHNVSAIVGALR
ncbi:MAG: zinc ABC transporter substrate-binding protein [Planctomycetes bacterium]|nr:zinc ABC transporter substrate-binding protein [Planctomycetota bacterium]